MQEAVTIEQMEEQRRARLASAWAVFASGAAFAKPERAPLEVVGCDRVGRRERRPRSTPQVAA